MTTIVLTNFVPSEAFKADPNVVAEGMQNISSIKGVIANYQGLAADGSDAGYSVQVATSPQAFAEALADKERFGKIMEQTAVGRVGDIKQCHFVAVSDPLKALVGPLTEISPFTLKDPTPENKEAVGNILAEVQKELGEQFTYGWCGEDPSTVYVLAAWDTLEAQQKRASQPDCMEAFAKYLAKEPTFYMVKLTKF